MGPAANSVPAVTRCLGVAGSASKIDHSVWSGACSAIRCLRNASARDVFVCIVLSSPGIHLFLYVVRLTLPPTVLVKEQSRDGFWGPIAVCVPQNRLLVCCCSCKKK